MKFRMDSPFITVGTRLADLLLLNVYFLLGCVPLVTVGPSLTAAYSVTLKMAGNQEPFGISRQFWTAYFQNMRHGIPLTVIFALGCYSIWIDWQLFEKLENHPVGFLLAAVVTGALLLAHFLYIFPLEARYENRMMTALSNSRKIFIRFFLRSVSLVGILLVQMFLLTMNAMMAYIGIFCGPILGIYTVSQVALPIFQRLDVNTMASDGFAVGAETDREI